VTVEQMRQYLIRRYPESKTWAEKVKHMSEAQVYSIYRRFLNQK
jgi:hypothetical protein